MGNAMRRRCRVIEPPDHDTTFNAIQNSVKRARSMCALCLFRRRKIKRLCNSQGSMKCGGRVDNGQTRRDRLRLMDGSNGQTRRNACQGKRYTAKHGAMYADKEGRPNRRLCPLARSPPLLRDDERIQGTHWARRYTASGLRPIAPFPSKKARMASICFWTVAIRFSAHCLRS